ncbi:MAG: 50S ribosomal protein L30 [Clostridiales bacterium]|nr:50S ribosomal protein L30 [Clostridiales bacterium]
MAKIKVTQIKSINKETDKQKANIKALGLKKIRDSRVFDDTPDIMGKIKAVAHLVKVEPADNE